MAEMDIVGLGAMNMDNLYRTRVNFTEGEDVVDESGQFPGGAAANTIYGLARLGMKAGFIGVVGNDVEGERLLEDFRNANVDVSRINKKDGSRTGSVLCLSDRAGKRALYVSPGANARLVFEDIDLDYLKQSKRLHISAFTVESQFEMLVKVVGKTGKDLQISFVPGALYSSKSLKVLSPLLEKTHLLIIQRSEIEQLTGTSYLKGARECIKRGCNVVAVTFGAGFAVTPRKTIIAYVRDENNEWEVEPVNLPWQPQPETTGAGDAFAAGYIFGDSIGKKPGDCAVLGDLVARMSITRAGARPGLPTRPELEERYRNLFGKPL
jgi:ribokinase